MENMTKNMEIIKVKQGSIAEGQDAPAGASCPSAIGGRQPASFSPPDPEVSANKARRKFTAKYKLRILDKADSCTEPGQIGSLLRREGLYSSYLTSWRRQKQRGLLAAMGPKKRGCPQKTKNPLADKLGRLEKENRKLREKLRKAEAIIDVQKKISNLLALDQNPVGSGGRI